MSQIQFSQNFENFLVPTENGQNLCSQSNPQEEGLRWAYSFRAIPTSHVVIIGLGAGFHVAALADIHPDLKITVIDCREALVPVFKAQFAELADRVEVMTAQDSRDLLQSELYKEIVQKRSFVLTFCESWGAQQETLSSLFAHATGRTVEAVRLHFLDLGINMKSFFFEGAQMLSLPDLMPAIQDSDLNAQNKQVFELLGELAHS